MSVSLSAPVPVPSTSTLSAPALTTTRLSDSPPKRPLSSPRSDSDSVLPFLRQTAEGAGCACHHLKDEAVGQGGAAGSAREEGRELSAGEAGRAARRSLDARRRRSLEGGSGLGMSRVLQEEVGGEKVGGFDRFGRPSEERLREAAKCMLVGESGKEIAFEDLIRERGQAVVVFLRHLWCGFCQQYVVALNAATHSLASLSSSFLGSVAPIPPLYILLISSGSPSLISTYRSRLNCPFPLYVDPKGRKLYKALGMTRKTLDGGSEEEKGTYVTRGKLANVVASTVSGLSLRGNPGNQSQLGGEFVFASGGDDEGIRCLYSSRMSTTRNHSEVQDLFAAAGVKLSPEDAESVFRTPISSL